MHAFLSLLVHTAHKLEQQTLLDNFMSINGGSNTLYQTRVDVIRVNHALELVEFRLSKRASEGLAIVITFFTFSSNVSASLISYEVSDNIEKWIP